MKSLLPFSLSLVMVSVIPAWTHDSVRLEDVRILTLQKEKWTTGRRNPPVEQMTCVGGDSCHGNQPDVIQCTNMGSDGSDVQWMCQAELPDTIKFGPVSVNCEGYNYPNDPYILKGSCGLEYTLYYTDKGRRKLENPWGYFRSNPQDDYYYDTRESITSELFSHFFTILWICVVGFILYNMWYRCSSWQRPGDRGWSGWFNGGREPRFGGGSGSGYDSSYYQQPYSPPPPYSSGNQRVPRPGFWSGFSLGNLTGYYLGSRNRNVHRTRDYVGASTSSRATYYTSNRTTYRDASDSNMRTAKAFGSTTRR